MPGIGILRIVSTALPTLVVAPLPLTLATHLPDHGWYSIPLAAQEAQFSLVD